MRSIVISSAVMAGAVATSLVGRAQAPDYSQVLAAARSALGGEARLNAVRTFRVKGAIEEGVGPGRTYGSFEIVCELPDKFVETESRRYVDSGQGANIDNGSTVPFVSQGSPGFSAGQDGSTIGFNADRAIYQPTYHIGYVGVGSRFMGPPSITEAQLTKARASARVDFVLWTTGLFARTSGAAQPIGQLQIDPVTHLPARLGAVEYLDYRDVDGFKVPFRLRRLKPFQTEWIVRTFAYNVTVPPKIFQPTTPIK
jgi:hypothetical protein